MTEENKTSSTPEKVEDNSVSPEGVLQETQPTPTKENKYIGIKFTPNDEVSFEEMESSLEETEEFRGNVRSSFYRWTQNPDKDISPHQMTGIYLFSLGTTSSSLNKAISNFSPTPEEEKFLKDTVETVRQLEETDLIRASSLQSAYDFPQLAIIEYNNIPPDDSDAVFFSRTDEGLSPIPPSSLLDTAGNYIYSKIKGELISLGKSALEKTGKEVAKKTGKEVAKKGAVAVTAGVTGVATGGVGTAVTVAIEVGEKVAKAVSKVALKTLSALTGIDERELKENTARLTKIGIPGLIAGFFVAIVAIIASITTLLVSAVVLPIAIGLLTFTFLVIFILIIINSGAYVVPEGKLVQSPPVGIPSDYINVEKVASSSNPSRTASPYLEYDNDDLINGLTIIYTITITAKEDSISNISISYDCRVISNNANPPPCPGPPSIPVMPPEFIISPTNPFVFNYEINYPEPVSGGPNYEDTFIIDTITVTGDSPRQTNARAATSATIKIGNPPEGCPSGWPVRDNIGRTYYITQGPYSTHTHTGRDAIDVSSFAANDDPNNHLDVVISTHTGIISAIGTDQWGGRHVEIQGNCDPYGSFTSRHVHFDSIDSNIAVGSIVHRGTVLGEMGETGWASHRHDHYEFVGNAFVNMETPYIPVDVPIGCVLFSGCGNITIP